MSEAVRIEYLNELELRMSDDLEWARTAPEVRLHPGKLVVVYKRQFLAAGTEPDAVLEEASRKAGCPKEHLVTMVVPPRSLEEVPH